jgi:hypothetical protein
MALPIPNLDDRTFEELVDEARKLIPVFTSRWTNHNLSDPGITLVDLFAWLTEMQYYHLNGVSDRHRLKYLDLLGAAPRPASPAKVDVRLSADEFIVVPAGTLFKTVSAPSGIIFESEEDIEIVPVIVDKVVSYANYQWIDVTDFNEQPYTYFHAFGQYPGQGDVLYLGLKSGKSAEQLAGKTMKIAVYPYEKDLPPVGQGLPGSEQEKETVTLYPPANTAWEYWNKDSRWLPLEVTAAEPGTPVLTQKGFLFMKFPAQNDMVKETPSQVPQSLKDDSLFWIRCRLEQAGYEIPPRIDRILTNVVPAVQGQAMEVKAGSPGLEIETGTLTGIDIPGVTVSNPFPSCGGSAEETVDEAFIRFKKELYTPCTAVTPGDYEYIARATPGLRVARARAVVSPGSNEVTVVVVPYSFSEKPVPGPGFKKTVCEFLDLHRPITTYIRVSDPDYVKVSVSVEIKLAPGYGPDLVRERVREALDLFLAPLDKTGGGDGWPFGRPVYRSEINEVLESVEGVDCVTALSLSGAEGSFKKRNGNIEISPLSLVYPGTHTIAIIDPHTKCEMVKK